MASNFSMRRIADASYLTSNVGDRFSIGNTNRLAEYVPIRFSEDGSLKRSVMKSVRSDQAFFIHRRRHFVDELSILYPIS